MQRCRPIVQCLWVFYFWRHGPGCSTGPAESQATHCGNTWQGGRRHSRQPGSRKHCRFRHARGGSSTHRSNFLRRISYRPKRSSGDAAGGPAGYEGPRHARRPGKKIITFVIKSRPPGQAALCADRPSESPTTHMRLDTPWRPARVLTISDGSVCDLSVSSRPPS